MSETCLLPLQEGKGPGFGKNIIKLIICKSIVGGRLRLKISPVDSCNCCVHDNKELETLKLLLFFFVFFCASPWLTVYSHIFASHNVPNLFSSNNSMFKERKWTLPWGLPCQNFATQKN